MKFGLATRISLTRWIRAQGFLAAAMLGLLAGRKWSPPVGEWLFHRFRGAHPISSPIVAMATTPSSRTEQVAMMVVIVGLVLASFAAMSRALRPTRRLELLACGVMFAGALAVSVVVLPLAAKALLFAGCTLAFVFGEYAGPRPVERAEDPLSGVATTVTCAALSTAWAAWITLQSDRRLAIGAAFLAIACAIVYARNTPAERIRSEAPAALPLLALPLVGLLRAPSFVWLLVAFLAAFVIRVSVASRSWRVSPAMTATVGVWSMIAILSIPLQFRDLPSLNHQAHEAGGFAWANSVRHGRFMMADAGTLYGPLRVYLHTLVGSLFGLTAEHLRQAQVLFNLVAVAALLVVARWLYRGRWWAVLWFSFLLLVASPLQQFVNYKELISFGWADLGRIAFPVSAAVFAVRAFTEPLGRRSLIAAGVACGLSMLYAQEMVLPLIGGAGVACGFHLLVARNGDLRAHFRRAAQLGGAALVPIAIFCGTYAAFGRLGGLARAFGRTSRIFASGQYGALPFPVERFHFTRIANLFLKAGAGGGGGAYEGVLFEFVLPTAVYVVALVVLALKVAHRRWTSRDSVEVALVVFGVLCFATATSRSDYLHIIAVTLPSLLLIVSIVADALDGAGAVAHVPSAPVRLVACGLVVGSFFLSGWDISLSKRLQAIAKGEEVPSTGPRYEYPWLPRAGDVRVPDDLVKVAEEVRRRTDRNESIFVRIGFTEGGEVYFLANRPNATKYDLSCEIFTEDDRANLLEALKNTPPKLIVGSDWGMPGPEVTRYIEQHWPVVQRFGSYELRSR